MRTRSWTRHSVDTCKPLVPMKLEEKPSELAGIEPTTNSTHVQAEERESNPRITGCGVPHPCSPVLLFYLRFALLGGSHNVSLHNFLGFPSFHVFLVIVGFELPVNCLQIKLSKLWLEFKTVITSISLSTTRYG